MDLIDDAAVAVNDFSYHTVAVFGCFRNAAHIFHQLLELLDLHNLDPAVDQPLPKFWLVGIYGHAIFRYHCTDIFSGGSDAGTPLYHGGKTGAAKRSCDEGELCAGGSIAMAACTARDYAAGIDD